MALRGMSGAIVAVLLSVLALAAPGLAQDGPMPDLRGEWTGEAEFRLPGGLVAQMHRFHIVNQTDAFIDGVHQWTNVDSSQTSHDGIEYTSAASEPFLGVIAHDQSIWIVEHGDQTMFRMTLLDADRLSFVAMEGGAHPLVGRGVLTRQ